MGTGLKHWILLVDDEESVIHALQRILRREECEILTAKNGEEGLSLLKQAEREFALIISDQRMPGMNGAEFLEKAKGIFPDAVRILLTGYSDSEAVIEAINRGGIHHYMAKPWNNEELLFRVRQALQQFAMIVENRQLLLLTEKQNGELKELNQQLEVKVQERTREVTQKNETLAKVNKELELSLYNTVRAFGSLVEMHNSLLAGHGRRVSFFSREIAQLLHLSEEEVIQIEMAGLLHDVGKLGLPQKILEYEESQWSDEDQALYQQHPRQGQATVQVISKLDQVGKLIRAHHERFNGEGFPDQLVEKDIPLGARIISAADAYDKIVHLNLGIPSSLRKTIQEIRSSQTHLTEEEVFKKAAIMHLKQQAFTEFDPDVVKTFLTYLAAKGIYKNERKVSIEELREGMVLSRPIYSSRGRFLLPHKTILDMGEIAKLKSHYQSESFLDSIYVFVNQEGGSDQ